MARIFYVAVGVGVLLILAVAALYPLPELQRYRSVINVITDGGREEVFTIEWPQDRINLPDTAGLARAGRAMVLAGSAGAEASAEVFRLHDVAGNVVGLASRTTFRRSPGAADQLTDWMLLLPARGSVLLRQRNSRDVAPQLRGTDRVPATEAPSFWAGGTRYRISAGPAAGDRGEVIGGTGEFQDLRGTYDENWELLEAAEGAATRGRITLTTRVGAVR